MFIDSDSLKERLKLSNRNIDDTKFRRDRVPVEISKDESIKPNSEPVKLDPDLIVELLPSRGRKNGYKNKSEGEKLLIGLEATLLGQTESARRNNVSQAYAGLCEKGKVNTDGASPVNGARKEKVDNEIEKLRSSALEGLQTSVSVLNERLSDSVKTSDAIGIASTLVKIVNISSPDEKRDQASRLIIMAPSPRDEKHYDVIDIN